jgi:AraC family transcriptional regulator
MDVQAELSAPSAQVRLVQYHFREPPESVVRMEDKIRVELCLSTRHRSARACFSERWSSSRFERIGEVFALPPTIDMTARSDEDRSLSSIICLLELPPVLALFDRLPDLSDRFLLQGLDIRDPNVRHGLLRLADEARHPGFASQIIVESIATQVSVDLLRYGAALPERAAQGGLAPWQLRRIEERLMEMREAPTLHELAALCRLSVRQLTRGFRVARGCSVGTHVADRQITHAKRRLAADESVATIATTFGFSSSSNFCTAFRRATGLTPGQYRQSLRSRCAVPPTALDFQDAAVEA